MDIRTYVRGLQVFGKSRQSRPRSKRFSSANKSSRFRLEQLEARTLLSGDLSAALQAPVVPQSQPAAIVQTQNTGTTATASTATAPIVSKNWAASSDKLTIDPTSNQGTMTVTNTSQQALDITWGDSVSWLIEINAPGVTRTVLPGQSTAFTLTMQAGTASGTQGIGEISASDGSYVNVPIVVGTSTATTLTPVTSLSSTTTATVAPITSTNWAASSDKLTIDPTSNQGTMTVTNTSQQALDITWGDSMSWLIEINAPGVTRTVLPGQSTAFTLTMQAGTASGTQGTGHISASDGSYADVPIVVGDSTATTSTPTPVVSGTTTQPISVAAYYVSTSGSDSNIGTADQPFRTIAHGLSALQAGETLYIRGGVYNETINSSQLPSGTSWANAPVIAGYPGESVVLTASGSGTDIITLSGSTRYVIFQNLILDGQGTAHNGVNNPGNSTDHIRFDTVEIRNFWNQGAFVITSLGGYEFLNCNVHHIVANGQQSANQSHGLYLGNSVLVDGGQYHDNGGYGIQIYNSNYPAQPTNNNIVRNTRIYHNATGGAGGGGITIGGDNNLIYNNLVYSNGSDGIDVVWGSPTNTQLYNNTVWNNNGSGGIYVSGSNTKLINNIVYQNIGGNITMAGGSGNTQATNLTSNPLFFNAASGDFRVQLGSLAINAGTSLSAVPVDMVGAPRPQGGAYDVGAYEA